MNLQQGQSPYTPVGGMPPSGTPPMLGQQNPVMANELPAQGGLSVLGNPMAQQLQSQGRGEDTMLVHMTPDEVNSLQGLAMATGGSLTINPQTGLPEAGWLSKLLPTIIGGALAATGVGAPLAAGIVGLGQTARTGSLTKGLMAGLGAFGGASLAGAAGIGSSLSKTGFGALSKDAGILGANMGAGAAANPVAAYLNSPELAQQFATKFGGQAAGTAGLGSLSPTVTGVGAQALGPLAGGPINPAINVAQQAATKTPGFFGKFAETARAGLPGGIVSKAAPAVAGLGVLSGVSGAMTPSGMQTSSGQVDNSYQGPYTAQKRAPTFAADTSEILGSSKERDYFKVDQPEIYNMQGQIVQPGSETAAGTPILRSYALPTPKKKKGTPMYGFRTDPYMQAEGFAKGGVVQMDDGGFVVDARTVAEAGNGFTEAGQNRYAQLGGIPLRGPGDGVSDSIPARIGRNQPARVAAGEVYMPKEAVTQIGGGDPNRGAKKLYAMMERAHKATKPGQKRDILKGLA